MMKINIKAYLFLLIGLIAILPAKAQDHASLKPKVIVVVADGLVGSIIDPSLGFVTTPHIDEMISMGFSDLGTSIDNSTPQAYPEAGWTSVLTGMNYSRSGVSDDISTVGVVGEQLSLFEKLSAVNRKTGAFVRSQDILNILAKSATTTFKGSSDADVVNKAVESLTNNADIDFTFVQLSNLLTEGKNGGFSGANTDYLLAVKSLDEQIGDLRNAIHSRSTYEAENWKFILTSSCGGKHDGTIGGTEPVEIFVPMVMSGRYVQRLEPKAEEGKNNAVQTLPYVLSSPTSGYGSHIFAIGENPQENNNITFGPEVTIELWAKQTIDRGGAWQTLFDCENDKCLLAIHRQKIVLYTNGSTIHFPRNKTELPETFAILPNTLYHYAVTIKPAEEAGKKVITIYMNGKIYGELITSVDFGTNRSYYSFNVGNGLRKAQRTNVLAAWVVRQHNLYNYVDSECFYGVFDEVRVWNKCLPQSTVQKFMRLAHVENIHPNKDDLFLYWTFDEVDGVETKDWSGNGYTGHFNWWTDADPDRIKVKHIPYSAFTLGSVYSTVMGHLGGNLDANAPNELNSTWYFLSQD
ncbi:hypothetical protein EYV94_25385 [Puteibacter caeruleilacunae]|nr:hypothetical protein EYV94_25385 [Puteibacter caeruleilacunae]